MVCQDAKLFMTETNELISCSTSPGVEAEMSDRKCKSTGATDIQSGNTKGARWRSARRPRVHPFRGISSLFCSAVVNIFIWKSSR